jgi:HSP20 family protein
MQNDLFYTTNPSVYRGEYVPLFKKNDLKKSIEQSCKNKIGSLPINITELENFYKIELAVPGVKRENLFLKAYENVLSISVIGTGNEPDNQGNFQRHEFNYDYGCTSKLLLPDNADAVFVIAEYKVGILYLYIPKSTQPLKGINTKIAVY